jgi:hypothetical protein
MRASRNAATQRRGGRWGDRRQRITTLAAGLAVAAVVVTVIPAEAAGADSVRRTDAAHAAMRSRIPDAARTNPVDLGNGYTRTRYTYSAAQIHNQRQTWSRNAQEQAKIDQHVDAMMRRGMNIDRKSVDIVPVEVPNKMYFQLVQDTRDQVNDFVVDITEKNGQEGFGMSFLVSYANEDQSAPTGADAGFDGGVGSNATKRGAGTRTVYFTPDYDSKNNVDHWVTQTYEKWQSNSAKRDWAYNSYATFDAANEDWDYVARLVDATIRARPYKGYESRVTGGPYDYEPRPQEVCQSVADLSINVGTYASLTIPVTNCYSGQEIYPNGTKHSMGTAWYGSTTAQRYLDFSFSFQAANTTTIPIMSDYIWMSVDYCYYYSIDCPIIMTRENNKWTDGGW